jgi:hypothetical protein
MSAAGDAVFGYPTDCVGTVSGSDALPNVPEPPKRSIFSFASGSTLGRCSGAAQNETCLIRAARADGSGRGDRCGRKRQGVSQREAVHHFRSGELYVAR